jgi:hypothetical protein
MPDSARTRVERLVAAARNIVDPAHALGRRARDELLQTTGLSREGIELGLTHLETAPSSPEMDALCASVPQAPRAHVLLSANVFIAAHRAIALALAASERVSVRASRRDPVLARLLCEATDAFELVDELRPEPESHVWAYGTDETLREIAARLPRGVVLHAHGAGIGVAVLEANVLDADARRAAAEALARDVVVFDQRGCLSPRVAFFSGTRADAADFAATLAQALDELERRVPRGEIDSEQQASIARYRDAAVFAGDVFPAGQGLVSLDESAALLVPPVGRNLRVTLCTDPAAALGAVAPAVTIVGAACSEVLLAEVRRRLPHARSSALGRMQSPPFDGPVDLRRFPGVAVQRP